MKYNRRKILLHTLSKDFIKDTELSHTFSFMKRSNVRSSYSNICTFYIIDIFSRYFFKVILVNTVPVTPLSPD